MTRNTKAFHIYKNTSFLIFRFSFLIVNTYFRWNKDTSQVLKKLQFKLLSCFINSHNPKYLWDHSQFWELQNFDKYFISQITCFLENDPFKTWLFHSWNILNKDTVALEEDLAVSKKRETIKLN